MTSRRHPPIQPLELAPWPPNRRRSGGDLGRPEDSHHGRAELQDGGSIGSAAGRAVGVRWEATVGGGPGMAWGNQRRDITNQPSKEPINQPQPEGYSNSHGLVIIWRCCPSDNSILGICLGRILPLKRHTWLQACCQQMRRLVSMISTQQCVRFHPKLRTKEQSQTPDFSRVQF